MATFAGSDPKKGIFFEKDSKRFAANFKQIKGAIN
jgi:hypothetical protein